MRGASVTRRDASRISSEITSPSASKSRITPGRGSSLSATVAPTFKMTLTVSVRES